MSSLAQLLAAHGSILVFDAASQWVQVGLLRAGQSSLWEHTDDEAGRGLFRGTETVLAKAGAGLGDIAAFAYCEGPGSMLGTRTVAMALRTWLVLKPRPVFAYQSLALAASAEWRRTPRRLAVIADARRESWHTQLVAADGTLGVMGRFSAAELPVAERLMPAGFRVWSKPPADLVSCSYDLSVLTGAIADADLFRSVELPDALQHEAPDYKKWSAQPHSAASVAARS